MSNWALFEDNIFALGGIYHSSNRFDLAYCDIIYEDLDFKWAFNVWKVLKPNGILIVQTGYHSSAELKCVLSSFPESNFVNWLVWLNDWGNHGTRAFAQVHDDILIFSKGKEYKWYPERVQVLKITAKSKGLNPSGRETKVARSVITDICLTTVSKERIKDSSGKNVPWQKPVALMQRLVEPFTDIDDMVLDPFMGTGSLGEWCVLNKREYFGIENDKNIFELAHKRLCQLK